MQRHQSALWRWATLVTVTYFLARAINTVVAYYYFPIEAPPRKISTEPLTAPKETNTQVITSRNLFDSEAPGRLRNAFTNATTAIVPSQLPLELIGTVVFQNSRFSVALIRERSQKGAQYYALGEQVLSARIHKIERHRVILENGARLESLELKAAESKLSASKPLSSQPTIGISPATDFEELSPNRYVIPQSTVDDVLANFNLVLTQARMVPNITPEGKTEGFKVFQIRDGSIYQKLQMKDNDIIRRVNGVDLDTFEKATGLFTALRNEKSISIDLVRNGQRINYTYEIR